MRAVVRMGGFNFCDVCFKEEKKNMYTRARLKKKRAYVLYVCRIFSDLCVGRGEVGRRDRKAMIDDKYNHGMIVVLDGDKLPEKGNVIDLGVKSQGASKNKMVIQDHRNILVGHNF
jgi:hypothetical protein